MQVEEQAGSDLGVARNPRVINMLRGGILNVKIIKSMQETEDGVPARASQVCSLFFSRRILVFHEIF